MHGIDRSWRMPVVQIGRSAWTFFGRAAGSFVLAACYSSVRMKTSSMLRSKASAISKARGREGSKRPFSMEFTEFRETPRCSANAAWLQPRAWRNSRIWFFMVA